ncbi:hypothetical protein KAU33_09280 [Candidatus Dependentiae bacterium]|nr:hypothetical protein [Candidatus Dependentiae bacterium]
MKFQVYKKEDGTEEVRLRPESAADCDSIDDCKKCFFEDSIESVCENEIGMNTPPVISNLEFSEVLRELGIELIPLKKMGIKPPEMTRYPQGFSIENMLEQLQNQKFGVGTQIQIREFIVKDGKVVTDPETREIMDHLGLIEKIEKQFEEDEN